MKTQEQLFDTILGELFDTYKKKNSDYGNTFEKLFKEFGAVYAYSHMYEKLMRIKTLMNNPNPPKVKEESIKDSLKDLASYAILTLVQILQSEEESENGRQ